MIINGCIKKVLNLFLSGIFLLVCQPGMKAQGSGIQSRWHDEDVYQAILSEYHKEKNIFYLVSNNQEYLFLNLLVPMPNEQKKILLFGLTIHIDLEGGSKKDLSILYPFGRAGRRYKPENLSAKDSVMIEQMMAERDPLKTRNPEGRTMMNFDILKYNLAAGARIMVLEGFTDTAKIVTIPSTDPNEVQGFMAYDSSGVLNYSLAIPFAKAPIREKMKKSGLSLGLETGYFNPEQSMAGRGGGPGGMGGRPGGWMGQGGGGRAGGGMGTGSPGGHGWKTGWNKCRP